jgi:hypothetical protein
VVLLLSSTQADAQTQVVDPDFTAAVETPAYHKNGPTVAIDEAHSNFHTATGQYRPFADILRSDGYDVKASAARFDAAALAGVGVLVIANALPEDVSNLSTPAFSEQECDVVREWVRAGGSLLLIADHAPFGSAAENLASRFGVAMGKGYVFDRANTGAITTQLTFSRENGLLGTHPILRGRASPEQVQVVQTFTGQSLSIPEGAAVLMSFSRTAREAATPADLNAEGVAVQSANAPAGSFGAHSTPVTGRAQGLAMTYGDGRLVVLGEAGFLSAQLIRFADGREVKFGMNVPGNDNRQFVLNVLHWLSRLME